MGGPPASTILQTDSLQDEGRALWGKVTREVEAELGQGGAQCQKTGSDTAQVSRNSLGIVLLNYTRAKLYVRWIVATQFYHSPDTIPTTPALLLEININ